MLWETNKFQVSIKNDSDSASEIQHHVLFCLSIPNGCYVSSTNRTCHPVLQISGRLRLSLSMWCLVSPRNFTEAYETLRFIALLEQSTSLSLSLSLSMIYRNAVYMPHHIDTLTNIYIQILWTSCQSCIYQINQFTNTHTQIQIQTNTYNYMYI